ncbi:MAG: MazG nucleotide pyrophosphohydrolase domain-containing protein [Parcubacteria group bacterium]
MEVKEFQRKIVELSEAWNKKRSVIDDEQQAFTHLVEEVGELAAEYTNQKARKDKFSEAELENAIGDSLMQLVRLANLRGLDIENVVMKIIKGDQKYFTKR